MRIYTMGCLMALVTLFPGCGNKNDAAPETVPGCQIVKDIPYIPGDTSVRHKLDLYCRLNTALNDVVLFVPGGAWRQGEKELYDTMAVTLASNYALTVVVINYRLSNPDQGAAIHPDHIHDVVAAFGWVRSNIQAYGGDPEQVFLFGQSAGAHLVSLMAADPSYLQAAGYSFADIRGVISMSGSYDLPKLVTFPQNPLGLTADQTLMYKVMIMDAFGSWDSTVAGPASPAWHAQQATLPFLLITTDLDMPGFVAEGELFFSQLNPIIGNKVTYHHLLQSDYSPETWSAATEMAAAEPMLAEYIGHYAEVVAINEYDHLKAPTTWIIAFIQQPLSCNYWFQYPGFRRSLARQGGL